MPKARHILSTLNFNEWYQRIESESGNSELRSDGQPRFPNLLYEDAFAQNALAHIAGIDFAHVNYQRGIEIGGKQYRIDFTIEEPGHVPIVIDIDGKSTMARHACCGECRTPLFIAINVSSPANQRKRDSHNARGPARRAQVRTYIQLEQHALLSRPAPRGARGR
jgi:hypothetical protein